MYFWKTPIALMALGSLLLLGCDDSVETPSNVGDAVGLAEAPPFAASWLEEEYAFSPAIFDIDATPDGSILVAENGTIKMIRRGSIHEITSVPAIPGSPINGLTAMGNGNYLATSGGLDLAEGAAVWHVTQDNAQKVGDVQSFETMYDPDALEGPQWKDQLCEEDPVQGFSAGPQSNPYHLTRLAGTSALVADAAGNTLLTAGVNGKLDWVAVFTPPVDENGDWRFLKTAESDPTVDCYVQPVPTSVAVGPDGDYFVGELTGAPGVPGWSRIWRIQAGAEGVVCPSSQCEVFQDGMTSVIDLAFGPDGYLYAVEYDTNGWLAVITGAPLGGGNVSRCDPDSGVCEVMASGLPLPSAITFDKWGNAWILENNIIAPTVRRLN